MSDLTLWHPSEAFGAPFEERKDVGSGLNEVRIRLTSQVRVTDQTMSSGGGRAFLKMELFRNLKVAYQQAEYDALHEPKEVQP